MTSSVVSPVVSYWQYLQRLCPALDLQTLSGLSDDLEGMAWEQPESALDLNNFAVMALIEADQCNDMMLRSMNLEIALEALEQGIEQQPSHPLCAAHLAIARHLTGENAAAAQISFANLLQGLQPVFQPSEAFPLGLVYLPGDRPTDHLPLILQAKDGMTQALLLLTEALWRSQQVFYSASGLRFLQLAVTLIPQSASLRLKLGLAKLMNQLWEGLVDLQQAHQIAPADPAILQALYLTYRELNQDVADSWLRTAQGTAQQAPDASEWQWTTLGTGSPFTYVPTPDGILLAVDPSFHSIVTSVLLAEGDWFETEMEFWRAQIQPGMTVIDVGANVGVYTFSAAQQVGTSGRVLTIEPFSSCVRCLRETCRLHQLHWVTVCAGAASDRSGTARLSLHSSSELNEVVRDADSSSFGGASGSFEDIDCFTLDDLIEQENLQQVDWLKIDAEGHEMQVLAGSDRLLTHFAPAILYENIAGASGSNTPVAELLQAKGYSLFRYQPYLQTLIPIQTTEQLQGNLNIIALPDGHPLIAE
ncbi:MAG: FkbM family methyltransferase [Drouetiella hepatica Uher 2000/2452]|jgi:FkbM family methyltransferase|uniref:FkbM family methyltransferase n=1 Tax=Drouetiella hepatica Uher 2000/2452 TaxID=904376 RepID=A0A951QDB6_9CYAN|nr:FkbM family methyltransferase [Drouetiella hepatica Uher 2000/2452]